MGNRHIAQDLDRMRHELDDLREEVGSLAHSFTDFGSEKAHRALKRAEALRRRAGRSAAVIEKRFDREIETHPLLIVLLAAGIGFLFGTLVGARR